MFVDYMKILMKLYTLTPPTPPPPPPPPLQFVSCWYQQDPMNCLQAGTNGLLVSVMSGSWLQGNAGFKHGQNTCRISLHQLYAWKVLMIHIFACCLPCSFFFFFQLLLSVMSSSWVQGEYYFTVVPHGWRREMDERGDIYYLR